MKTIAQLFRSPIKTISNILIIAIAVAILPVCMGQSIVAQKTENTMQQHFTTIALLTTKYQYEDVVANIEGIGEIQYKKFLMALPDEIVGFVDALVIEHPELVKTIANPGLASAYIPELKSDNESNHFYYDPSVGNEETISIHYLEPASTYEAAMLEIVLDEIGDPVINTAYGTTDDGTEIRLTKKLLIELSGTIMSTVSLEDGYADPIGKTIHISMELPDEESLETLNLEIGGRYLVYGTDYLDGDWAFCGWLSDRLSTWTDAPVVLDAIDQSCIEYYSQNKIDALRENNPYSSAVAVYHYLGGIGNGGSSAEISESKLKRIGSVSINVKSPANEGSFILVPNQFGGYPTLDFTRYITNENGNKVVISEKEWLERYEVPTMVCLDGTVEEFLASDEGALWQRQLEYMEINNHAFPIIGVEKLGYIADFSRENARIVDGRDFTEEELTSGAKVCILSETLAAANGLKVGDIINPQFYNYDYDNPNQEFLAGGKGVVNPWAYKFCATTEWAGTEEYTIVGLYRQNNAWGDVSENLYSFTPNTIFVPITSVTSDMDYANQGFFQTLVLQNGAVEEFRALVDEAGYEGLFVYYDQEYTTIADTLMNYREVAEKAMIVGIVVYGVILLLFLLLFPASQGKTLNTMNALGATRWQRFLHVLCSSTGILIPGTLIGLGASVLLWDKVIEHLAQGVGGNVTLEMDATVLATIALAQLVLALMLTALLALPISRDKGMRRRK